MSPPAPTNSAAAYVIVARHGERLDYVWRDKLGRNWVQEETANDEGGGRPWDPPLTDHGWEQGRRLGRQLAQEVAQRGIPPISAVYASPFWRCRQTALAAWQALNNGESTVPKEKDSASKPHRAALPPVRVEFGLAESLNEAWYRSWALPGADGSWGYRQPGTEDLDDPHLEVHPAAARPVQSILADWRAVDASPDRYDLGYDSMVRVDEPYALRPERLLESREQQRRRMRQTLELLAVPGQTIVIVSHGGPVTHLFEFLTQQNWQAHGESTYCCYSLYVGTPPLDAVASSTTTSTTGTTREWHWKVVVLNESSYLREHLTTERHVSSDAL